MPLLCDTAHTPHHNANKVVASESCSRKTRRGPVSHRQREARREPMLGVSDGGASTQRPKTADRNRVDCPDEATHRNVICCLLALEIADYDAKPVFEQIRSTQSFRQLLSDATAHTAPHDLVLMLREDGALLSFLADPEECFATAIAIREATLTQGRYRDLPLRIGINLGKAQIAEDEFGNPYLSGEGRQDADRLMRQGPPRQISVARQFVELLSRTAPELAELLEYQGLYSDTVGPHLCLYRVSAPKGLASENLPDQPATIPLSLSLIDSQTLSALDRGTAPAQSAVESRNSLRRSWLSYALLPLLAGAALALLSNSLHVEAPAFRPYDQVAAATPQTATSEAAASSPALVAPLSRIALTAPAAIAVDLKRQPSAASWRAKPRRELAWAARPIKESTPRALQRAVAPDKRSEGERTVQAEGLELTRGAPVHGARAATLLLTVKPWGEVYVDGTKIGVTPPLKRFELPPGRRLITITNGSLPRYQSRLVAEPGAQVTVVHDFDCVSNREKTCREGFGKGLELRSSLTLETAQAGRSR